MMAVSTLWETPAVDDRRSHMLNVNGTRLPVSRCHIVGETVCSANGMDIDAMMTGRMSESIMLMMQSL